MILSWRDQADAGATVPVEIADAVTLWFRQRSLNARLYKNRHTGKWHVRVERMLNDPGRVADECQEIPLEVEDWITKENGKKARVLVPMNIHDYGATGVIEWLEKRDVKSGRGEYASLEAKIAAEDEANAKRRAEMYEEAADAGREIAWLTRRQVYGLPLVSVPADINKG